MRLQDFKLEAFFDEYEFSTPYLLAQSDCQAMTVAELLRREPGAENMLHATWLGYTETAGSIVLREQVAELYPGMHANNVLMHCGAEEAIFAYMNVVLSPGDQVICLTPTYQSLLELPQAIGAEVRPWRLRNRIAVGKINGVQEGIVQAVEGSPNEQQVSRSGSWYVDFDELATLITPKTKLIIINTPNNPTGYTFTDAEILRLVNLAAVYDIKIFSDEVYRGLDLDGVSRPTLAEVYDHAVTLGVMSKAYGLAGLRVGWLVGADTQLLADVRKYKHYLSICNSVTSEVLAGIALKHGQAIIARNVDIIRQNVTVANNFFTRYSSVFVNNPPQCGSVAFHRLRDEYVQKVTKTLVNVSSTGSFIESYCTHVAQQAGVLLLPGSTYAVDEPYFRMGYGREDFVEGLAVLDHYLQREIV